VDHLGGADQLQGDQAAGALQVEATDPVLVAVDGGQHQVGDPVDPGQPVGQLVRAGQVEAEPGGLAADLGGHGLGPLLVPAGEDDLAALVGVVAGHL
jgi:hypothetical protein